MCDFGVWQLTQPITKLRARVKGQLVIMQLVSAISAAAISLN